MFELRTKNIKCGPQGLVKKTCSKSAKSIMYFVNNSMNTKDLETNKISQKYLVTYGFWLSRTTK